MKKIAISIFHDRVASRLDSAENLMLVTADDGKVKSRELILLRGEDPLRKIDKIIQLKPDVLICGGLTKICEDKLGNSNIKIFPWIQGKTEYILSLCLRNKFIDGDFDRGNYKSKHHSHF
ncbi:NifB/NifX family molybdenum-iron cluster-binding protein [Bacteroidota bacterium]